MAAHCRRLRVFSYEYTSALEPDLEPAERRAKAAVVNGAVAALAAGCGETLEELALWNLALLRDRTVAVLAERCGGGDGLRALSLNGAAIITDRAVLALAAHCGARLVELDLSWCRRLTDDGLGLATDRCPALAELRLWGCNQLTAVFLEGHSCPRLSVVGRPSRAPVSGE
eukprot:SAG11_NODE_4522_length_1865_cov_1.857305_1_plen_171_part_00